MRICTKSKENEIVEAATRIFASRPFQDVLMDDVAQEGGIGKGTIYRYFESKEALYLATIREGVAGLNQHLEQEIRDAGSPEESLRKMVEAILAYFWDRRELHALMSRSDDHLRLPQEKIRAERERLLNSLARVLQAGTRRGEFRASDPRRMAEFCLGLIRTANLFHRPDETVAELTEQIVSVFLDGIRRRRPS